MGFGSFRCLAGSGQPQVALAGSTRTLRSWRNPDADNGGVEKIDSLPVVKSLPVVALADVVDDVQAAYDYFELRVPGAGNRFFERYFAATDEIGLNPEAFSIKFDDYRRALVRKSNLAAYYFVEPQRAVIVAVIDARRHPRLIRGLVRERR